MEERVVFDTIHTAVKNNQINFRDDNYYVTTKSGNRKTKDPGGTWVYNNKGEAVASKKGKAKAEYLTLEGNQFLKHMDDPDCWKTLVNDCPKILALFVIRKGGMGVDCPRIKHVLIYSNPKMSNEFGWLTKTVVQQLGRATRQWFGGISTWKQFARLPAFLQESVYENCYCWTGILPETKAAVQARADMETKHSVPKNINSIYAD